MSTPAFDAEAVKAELLAIIGDVERAWSTAQVLVDNLRRSCERSRILCLNALEEIERLTKEKP